MTECFKTFALLTFAAGVDRYLSWIELPPLTTSMLSSVIIRDYCLQICTILIKSEIVWFQQLRSFSAYLTNLHSVCQRMPWTLEYSVDAEEVTNPFLWFMLLILKKQHLSYDFSSNKYIFNIFLKK